MTSRTRIATALAGLALLAVFWWLPDLRRMFIRAVVTYDAPRGDGPTLPRNDDRFIPDQDPPSEGLPPADFVRVVLIDGAGRETAARMPAWNALCARGLQVAVDVGFPTVSLPVQVTLWSGRTQQQTGVVFRSGRPLVPPLGIEAIPAQVPGSVAIAEASPYIVRSLGFARTLPAGAPGDKALPPGWDAMWAAQARAEVASNARLVFVHVLRVDAAGHKHGRASAAWETAAAGADAILADLIAAGDAAHPDARWIVLADHGHLPGGGHGGEELDLRRVRACIAGAGTRKDLAGPIALVDLSRAIADSVGATLPRDAPGRPLSTALVYRFDDDELIPGLPLATRLLAGAVLVAGILASGWACRRRWAWLPWWWLVAVTSLLIVRGAPTLSTPFIYPPQGRDMLLAIAPGLVLLAPWAALLTQRCPGRALVALLALPAAAFAAAWIAAGGLPLLAGAEVAPVAPRWTAWTSALAVILASGAGAAGLAALATAVRPGSGRRSPPAAPRSEP
jgi:hypothetical protein